MLFYEAVKLYLQNLIKLERSENTLKVYKYHLEKFSNYLTQEYIRPIHLDEVNTDDVEKYIYTVFSEEKYSSSTRHNMVTSLKGLYSFCSYKGYCKINIGKLIKHIKVETPERSYITEMELFRISKNIKNPAIRAILQTMFYSGLRINECIKLKLKDVDFENEYIQVKEGKGKKERNVPLNRKLKTILQEYLKNGRIDKGTERFFSTRSGGISPEYIGDELKEALTKTGIQKRITSHVMRHSFASNLVERGVDLLRVQKLLGHESILTTNIYLHTSMEELEKTVNLL